jgi:hypothetical protein
MAPLLQGLYDYTGMQAMLIMGGPMPKYNGEIATVQYVLSDLGVANR